MVMKKPGASSSLKIFKSYSSLSIRKLRMLRRISRRTVAKRNRNLSRRMI